MSETAGEATATTAPAEGQATTETSTTDTAQVKTPEWYESELTKVRQEAASQRVKKQEAVKAKESEVTETFKAQLAESANALEAAKNEAAAASVQLAKLTVALEAKIPSDKVIAFSKALQGDTPDALKAHAEELKGLFGASGGSAVDPSQGLGSATGGADPAANAFAAFVKKSLS
jgi:hypothetical protein